MELAPYNIRVNSIAPGVIKTQLSWRRWSDRGQLKESERNSERIAFSLAEGLRSLLRG